MLRIALVDDHQLFRAGLRALVAEESDLVVVAEASTAHEACAILEAARPDVALIDVTLPGTSGISVTKELARLLPSCRVLLLTMHEDEELLGEGLAAGAAGYALKTQPAAEVIAAIRTVGDGRRYIAPRLARFLSRADSHGSRTRLDDLSPREREVFDILLQGYSNQRISEHLFISVKTVETHRSSINRKLGVHSTGELVRFAALHGLVHD